MGDWGVNHLEKWLKKHESGALMLAAYLGYHTESSIWNWISRGSIPSHQLSRVKTFVLSKNKMMATYCDEDWLGNKREISEVGA